MSYVKIIVIECLNSSGLPLENACLYNSSKDFEGFTPTSQKTNLITIFLALLLIFCMNQPHKLYSQPFVKNILMMIKPLILPMQLSFL